MMIRATTIRAFFHGSLIFHAARKLLQKLHEGFSATRRRAIVCAPTGFSLLSTPKGPLSLSLSLAKQPSHNFDLGRNLEKNLPRSQSSTGSVFSSLSAEPDKLESYRIVSR